MTFERARSKENKEIRLKQIKEAAIRLFDKIPYHEISLSKIGKEINFTRGNLYKYISSKEDIYIYIIIDEFKVLLEEMKEELILEEKLDTKSFAKKWAMVLNNHPRFLKLVSLLFTIIEQNAHTAILITFKNYLVEVNHIMFRIFTHNFPEFTQAEIGKLFDYSFSMIIARYAICNPTKNQIEAAKLSNYNYTFPNFVDSMSDAIVLLINGIKLSKI
ncbi:TetR family transcriptional regulator [Vallitalea pronyensis]|uniref:TetR family transcriptional regulator n=1 Tax=Vallitalea pronyensis TaxID=1348613 RepID=A0A8J8SJ97_9FIRM|nr:TetR/AcrR family transcriptional regulator [Vallitalea pronyensis]QUI25259.1 TetR family transcriptional regulator [Vallitalea pronyensis]